MDVIYSLDVRQIEELYKLYQQEWWTQGRTLSETRSCVEGSQINIGLVDERGSLKAFVRVLTDYTFKALIFDLIIAKDYRGIGLGGELISLIKHHKELQRVKHFELYCLPEMFPFYEKHGFTGDVGQIRLMRYTNNKTP